MRAIFMKVILPQRHRAAMLVLAALITLVGCASGLTRETVTLGGRELHVWVADTAEKRTTGLGGFDRLAEDEGMLFVYPDAQEIVFGIKGVDFAIEVVFIAEDGTISAIDSLSPGDGDRRVTSPTPSRYALELSPGWCEENGVAVGSVFERP